MLASAQKRGHCRDSKRGQVTLFIILGMVILISVGFMLALTAMIQKGQLQVAEEDVVSNLFQTESLRLFIDDCLYDALEEGLVQIGEQGRLWKEQDGGTVPFVAGETGTFHFGKQVYYAISYDNNSNHSEAYPCSNSTDLSPDYCRYSFPEEGKFGEKEHLSASAIEGDLLRYITQEAALCMEEVLQSNYSLFVPVVAEEIDLSLDIATNGIAVEASYPLHLEQGGEEYTQLTEFDFFYSSSLSSFLLQAVTRPINEEQSDPTYLFSEADLQSSEPYQLLDPTFTKTEASSGDTIIQYNLNPGVILENQDYFFQFALENRPPALDYIERNACLSYDYLVLEGEQGDMGKLLLDASASDPEEDSVTFSLLDDHLPVPLSSVDSDSWSADLQGAAPGYYNFTLLAADEHGRTDLQNVRVLLDREITAEFSVASPYCTFAGDHSCLLSTEDPFFVTLTNPGESLAADVDEVLELSYDGFNGESFVSGALYPSLLGAESCIGLPMETETSPASCNISAYDPFIESWKDSLLGPSSTHPYLSQTTPDGELSVAFFTGYCGAWEYENKEFLHFEVAECIPHENLENPFAYPYHHQTFDPISGEYLGLDEEISPFLAAHSCCNMNGTYKAAGSSCYESAPGCYGGIVGWTSSAPGLVLEQESDTCSGLRGNVCGTGSSKISELYQGNLVCGSSFDVSCSLDQIPDVCEGRDAWGYVDENFDGINDAWCHGQMGCSALCSLGDGGSVVYSGGGVAPSGPEGINQQAVLGQASDDAFAPFDPFFSFSCGCSSATEGSVCDANFDGEFLGQCVSSVCVE